MSGKQKTNISIEVWADQSWIFFVWEKMQKKVKLSQACLECPKKKGQKTWIGLIYVEQWQRHIWKHTVEKKSTDLPQSWMAAVTEGLPLPFGGNETCHLAIIATIIIIISEPIININMPQIGRLTAIHLLIPLSQLNWTKIMHKRHLCPLVHYWTCKSVLFRDTNALLHRVLGCTVSNCT